MMEIPELDENFIQTLEAAVERAECTANNSGIEKLESVYLKLGAYIEHYTAMLPENEDSLSYVLQIIPDLVETYGISESACVSLVKPVLYLIIDEKCAINSMKRGIHVLNYLLQNPSVVSSVAKNEALEGSLQILGRKVPTIGDYECQALLFESLYRITCDANRGFWVNIWFSDATARTMFLNLDPQKFESDCRKALNYINRSEPERRVYSFIANSVMFGTLQLKGPHGCEFWIDFNYCSQSISFYCTELNDDQSHDDSTVWETILIGSSSVDSYFLIEGKKEKMKELVLLLNCPCRSLITSSNNNNLAFDSHQISITFWGILNIHQHLEKIYGKEKLVSGSTTEERHKSSDISDAIQLFEESEIRSGNILPQRKASILSQPISISAVDPEDFIPETNEVTRKISYTREVIKIPSPECVLHKTQNMCKIRKVSDSSEIIMAEAYEDDLYLLARTKRSSKSIETVLCNSENDTIQTCNTNCKSVEEVCENFIELRDKRKISSSYDPEIHDEDGCQVKKYSTRKKRVKTSHTACQDNFPSINDEMTKNSTRKKRVKTAHTACQDNLLSINDEMTKSNVNKFLADSDCGKSLPETEVYKSLTTINDSQNKEAHSLKFSKQSPENNIDKLVSINHSDEYKSNLSQDYTSKHKDKTYTNDSKEIHQAIETSSQEIISQKFERLSNEINENMNSENLKMDIFESKTTAKEQDVNNRQKMLDSQRNSSQRETEIAKSHKKIRLYNLDSAPVYDVPPSSQDQVKSSSGTSSEKKSYTINENQKNISDREINSAAKRRKRMSEDQISEKAHPKSSSNMKTDKQSRVYEELPQSDEDFQNNFNRRRTLCETKNSQGHTPITKPKKREAEPLPLQSSEIQPVKSSRKPRKAAVKAMKKNKKIFDTSDDADVKQSTPSPRSAHTSGKRRKYAVHTDGETGSSEVSWLNKNKSCTLFETPKKSYSEWKKSRAKSLPVKVISNPRSSSKVSSSGIKKGRHINKPKSTDSESKSKSQHGYSDLENFNLTIEKTSKRQSSFMKTLESEFYSTSTNSFKKSSDKSYQLNSKLERSNYDKKENANSENFLQRNQNEVTDIFDNNPSEDLSGTNSRTNINLMEISKFHKSKHSSKSSTLKEHLAKLTEYDLPNHVPAVDARSETHKLDMNKYPDELPVGGNLPKDNEISEFQKQSENEENAVIGSALEDSGVEANADLSCMFPEEGKRLHLDYFLDCVAEYFNSRRHIESSSYKTESLSGISGKRKSSESLTSEKLKKRREDSVGSHTTNRKNFSHGNEPLCDINVESLNSREKNIQIKRKKHKAYEIFDAVSINKRQKLDHNRSLTGNIPPLSDKLSKSRDYFSSNSRASDLSLNTENIRNLESQEHDVTGSQRKHLAPEKLQSVKYKSSKKSKRLHDISHDSLLSKISAISSAEMKYDKHWFDVIITALSLEANDLTQKLLATVQKYVYDYSSKMCILRMNIVKVAQVLENNSSQNASENTLKCLIKSCRASRSEVEKSLKKISRIAKEYFEAEHRIYKKLKSKHIKASKKYISSMLSAKKIAQQKLERNILMQLKSITEKFVKRIANS